jgi:hypothetical protein
MSFTSAHNDYLDPDRHNPPEDYGYDGLLEALKKRDTGRWSWDEIDACWTGKYADLDPHGYQGMHLDSVDDMYAHATAHIGKTFAGTDVSLNVPRWVEEEDSGETYGEVLDIFMEQAQEVVCGCNVPGDWSGDDWFLTDTVSYKVPVVLTKEGEVDFDATADALIAEGEKALADIEQELVLADQIMETLAGWRSYNKDGKATHHKEGEPCEGSAWDMYQWTQENKD